MIVVPIHVQIYAQNDLCCVFPGLLHAVEGVMCLVKWGSDKLVVYTTNKGIHYMGLYQVRPV